MTQFVTLLNVIANRCADIALAPLASLPGWLSLTLVASLTGVFMLLVFKYTSRQRRIKQVRNRIKADLLALSLFKDNVAVSLRCQRTVVAGAGRLLLLALVPMLVMTVPMCLLLAQLALWYHARPLRVGEDAVLTVQLAEHAAEMSPLALQTGDGVAATIGPVRVPSKSMACWNLQATRPGYHRLVVHVDGRTIEKELAVGDGFMRVSLRKPSSRWSEVLLHPREKPFPHDSPVQGVEISYPKRAGWTCGPRSWLVYWFVVSLAAAFGARPWLKVDI